VLAAGDAAGDTRELPVVPAALGRTGSSANSSPKPHSASTIPACTAGARHPGPDEPDVCSVEAESRSSRERDTTNRRGKAVANSAPATHPPAGSASDSGTN